MKKYYSAFMMLMAAAIWGFGFSSQKVASALSPFTMSAVRTILAGLFLIPVIMISDRLTKSERRLFSKTNKRFIGLNKTELIGGIVCGTVLTVAQALQQYGINGGTDAGKSAFITALYVLFVPILGLLIKRRSPINVWVSVAIAVVGFWLLCIKENFTVAASDLLVLLCAVIFALHIIFIDKFSPGSDGIRLSCVQFFVAFVLSAVVALIVENPIAFDVIGEYFPHLFYLGVCSSGIAFTLQIVAQKNVHPAAAAVILSLESVFGVVGSAIFLKEVMQPREYIGCIIVFFAVILSQIDVPALVKAVKSGNNSK